MMSFVREVIPIIIHVNLDTMMRHFEKDTHYRNQFETSTSGGLLKPKTREKWERDLFGGAYEKVLGFDRPKYAVLNVMNDFRGIVRCKQYGDSYIVLKDVRLRCTLSPQDSANLKAGDLSVLDYNAHVLNEYTEAELKEVAQVSSGSTKIGDSFKIRPMQYKEVQVHGPIAFGEHVERLVANARHRSEASRLQRICRRHNWEFSFMDDEERALASRPPAVLSADGWEERLRSAGRDS